MGIRPPSSFTTVARRKVYVADAVTASFPALRFTPLGRGGATFVDRCLRPLRWEYRAELSGRAERATIAGGRRRTCVRPSSANRCRCKFLYASLSSRALASLVQVRLDHLAGAPVVPWYEPSAAACGQHRAACQGRGRVPEMAGLALRRSRCRPGLQGTRRATCTHPGCVSPSGAPVPDRETHSLRVTRSRVRLLRATCCVVRHTRSPSGYAGGRGSLPCDGGREA